MILGIHFPKAGGTSLAQIFGETFGDRLLKDYAENPAAVESPRNIDPAGYFARSVIAPAGIDCIYGHVHTNKYRDLKGTRFNILRHPVDTIFSIHSFWNSRPPGGLLHRYAVEQALDVVSLARLPLLRRLSSEAYFGGVDMSLFDVIGRHDEWRRSLELLSERTGILFNLDIRSNVTPHDPRRREMEADQALRARLQDILIDDIRFYERHAFRHL